MTRRKLLTEEVLVLSKILRQREALPGPFFKVLEMLSWFKGLEDSSRPKF